MTPKHFEDLTKIDCPFGMLDEDTKDRMYARNKLGHSIQAFRWQGWQKCTPEFLLSYTYRLAPQPDIPDQVEWEYIADWVNFVVRDKDGSVWQYERAPEKGDEMFFAVRCECAELTGSKAHRPGNLPWDRSLAKRPGVV